MSEQGYQRLFWVCALGLFCYHLVYIWLTPLDLAPDEAYYWDWSRRLAFGYYSKPPMVAWIIGLFTGLGGDTPFFVRFGAALSTLGTGIAIFFLARAMFGSRAAFWAFALANATPGFAVSAVIMSIDPPLFFFWSLTILTVYGAVTTPRSWMWYVAGFPLGLGLLTKYIMAALIPSVFLFLLASGPYRFWLRRKEPYLFVLIGCVILSPNLYWIYSQQWITFQHTASLVEEKGPSLLRFLAFFAPQGALLSPLTFILILYGLWQGFNKGIRHGETPFAYLWMTTAPLWGSFVILSFFSVCYVNWAASAYVAGFVLAVGAVVQAAWSEALKKRILMCTLIVGIFATLVTHQMDAVHALALRHVVPATRLPTSRLKGWHQLGIEVGVVLDRIGRDHTFIVSDKRQISSELAFYVPGTPTVFTFNPTEHAKSQYDLWPGYADKRGHNALYVTKGDRNPPSSLAHDFDSVTKLTTVIIDTKGEPIHEYAIHLCRNFRR